MSTTPRGPLIRVDVTEELIDRAIKDGQRDSRHCMIADAVRAAFPNATYVSVDLATIRATDPRRGFRYTYLTPRIAQVELVHFDQGLKPKPFKFQLRSAQVTKSGSNPKSSSNTTHEKKRPMTAKELRARRASAARLNALKKSRLVRRETGHVADRVGGETPPLQVGSDNVPFSRRRAFGIRALEY